MINSARVRVLLVSAVAIASVVTAVRVLQKRSGYYATEQTSTPSSTKALPAGSSVGVAPEVASSPGVTVPPPSPPDLSEVASNASPLPTPSQTTVSVTLDPSYVGKLNLIIPVAGVKPEQLQDTFKDSRSEGRVHDAIDIPAPAGTPVIATAEGEILKLFESELGGTTIYQASKDKKLVFYYAHLQRYAEGLVVGKTVWQGKTIGYVGDTGNAGAGNYHLHFSIMVVKDPKRYWEGTNINPYPLLRK